MKQIYLFTIPNNYQLYKNCQKLNIDKVHQSLQRKANPNLKYLKKTLPTIILKTLETTDINLLLEYYDTIEKWKQHTIQTTEVSDAYVDITKRWNENLYKALEIIHLLNAYGLDTEYINNKQSIHKIKQYSFFPINKTVKETIY